MARRKKFLYVEPADYFPKSTRIRFRAGEYFNVMTRGRINYLVKSVVLGHAVADALGVPVEFQTREEIAQNPVIDMRGYGTYPYPSGTWSDDTSMTLCALEALSHENWKWEDVMSNFGAWLGEGQFTPTGETFDVGRTCLKAVMNYVTRKMPIEMCGGRSEYSNGNGSLMRIHPFVLYASITNNLNYEFFRETIKKGSELTHTHERSVLGCQIYGYILGFLLTDQSKECIKIAIEEAYGDLKDAPEISHYNRIFQPDFDKLSREEINSSGYVVDSLEAALWCLLTTNGYKECVLKAVNLGGDTDTIAAIAGGLAGALYGYDTIPEEWLSTLAKRGYIEDLCDRASKTWFCKVQKDNPPTTKGIIEELVNYLHYIPDGTELSVSSLMELVYGDNKLGEFDHNEYMVIHDLVHEGARKQKIKLYYPPMKGRMPTGLPYNCSFIVKRMKSYKSPME